MIGPASLLSRRLILGMGGAAVTTAAVVVSPLRRVLALTAPDLARTATNPLRVTPLADAGFDDWLDQVGSIFNAGGGTVLKLVAVDPMQSQGQRPLRLGRDSAFLAKFDVQNGGTMAGDLIYTVSHPRGAFQIFLSASTNLPSRMTALFN